jgi:hypothetical protein
MKKNLLFVITFVTMCVTVLAQPSPMEVTIEGTNRTIEVDGYEDDDLWIDIEVLTFDYAIQGTMPGPGDCDGSLQVAWNEQGFLMMLIVTDDVGNYFAEGENSWEQDNLEIFFYFGEEGTWGPDAEITTVASDTLFTQIRMQLTDEEGTRLDGRYLGEYGGPVNGDADTGACEVLAVVTGGGWNVEAIMPWTIFGMTSEPAEGMLFGFEAKVSDADESNRDLQISLMNDTQDDLSYDNKKYLNTGILGAVTNLSNLPSRFVNTVSVYPTLVDNELNLTGVVNSLTIYDVTGQTVLSFKDNNITTVDVSALQPGIYFVNLNNNTTQKIIIR